MNSEDQKLNSLKQRINHAEDVRKQADARVNPRGQLPADAMALLGRVATEMVAGVAVGGFLGWALDQWLGTTPLMMLVLLFFGAAAGMMNIWRMAMGHGLKIGYFDQHNSASDAADDDQNK